MCGVWAWAADFEIDTEKSVAVLPPRSQRSSREQVIPGR